MRRLLAVLGRDVSQSLSPLLHTRAADGLDLDVVYIPVSCPNTVDFHAAVDALRTLGSIGCNVTIPYKQPALQRSQRVSTTAQEIGAVNTLSFSKDGRIHGDNTDGPGLLRVLEALPRKALRIVQILGAGGAARAAAWAVRQLGAESVFVTARRQAQAVAELAGGKARTLEIVPNVTLVISSLPNDRALAEQALSNWIDLNARPVIQDLAYGGLDRESPLVLLAKARGLSAFDGRLMLVEQAALSLSLWTGGDVNRIRSIMRAALNPFPEVP